MNVASIMFSLIGNAIAGTPVDETVKGELTAEVYRKIYTLAENHDVAHLVAYALSENGLLGTDEVSNRFNKKMMLALYRDTQKEYSLRQVCDTLKNGGINFMPLKGSVIRDYYPEPWMRTSCDIDVLVHKSDAVSAEKCLRDAGFTRAADRTTYDYNFFSPNKTHIELHYNLEHDNFNVTAAVLDEAWKSAAQTENGSRRYAMRSEYFILYHVAHMAKHLVHGGCGIRPFIDLWLLDNKMPYDKEKLTSLMQETGLADLWHAALSLGKVWMENFPHTQRTELLEEYILSGGVYGTVKNSAKVSAAKGRGKVGTLLNMMFLSRESLSVLYPALKKRPALYPLYQIKRWFLIFNADKRKRVMNATSAHDAISDTAAAATKQMLEDIGLLNKR